MKAQTTLLLALTVICTGCSWNPSRDNVFDPNSPYYSRNRLNRSPNIESPYMVTDCEQRLFADACKLVFSCQISDSDGNVLYDSLSCWIKHYHIQDTLAVADIIPLGTPSYNPATREFVLEKNQVDLPEQSLSRYTGDRIWVRVIDDSGAVALDSSTIIHQADKTWPILVRPLGDPQPDSVYNDGHPRLVWRYWAGGDSADGHTFSVQVRFRYTDIVWDTAGLAWSDTFVVVTPRLPDDNLTGDFYSWYLTVTSLLDNHPGDRMTARPGFFQIIPPHR
jgi:hypothetical protein